VRVCAHVIESTNGEERTEQREAAAEINVEQRENGGETKQQQREKSFYLPSLGEKGCTECRRCAHLWKDTYAHTLIKTTNLSNDVRIVETAENRFEVRERRETCSSLFSLLSSPFSSGFSLLWLSHSLSLLPSLSFFFCFPMVNTPKS